MSFPLFKDRPQLVILAHQHGYFNNAKSSPAIDLKKKSGGNERQANSPAVRFSGLALQNNKCTVARLRHIIFLSFWIAAQRSEAF